MSEELFLSSQIARLRKELDECDKQRMWQEIRATQAESKLALAVEALNKIRIFPCLACNSVAKKALSALKESDHERIKQYK